MGDKQAASFTNPHIEKFGWLGEADGREAGGARPNSLSGRPVAGL